jgi:hypothetical protein
MKRRHARSTASSTHLDQSPSGPRPVTIGGQPRIASTSARGV